jgi:hypothetical protein
MATINSTPGRPTKLNSYMLSTPLSNLVQFEDQPHILFSGLKNAQFEL